jgi:hypothetical protein
MTTKSIQKEVTLSPYDVADHLRTPDEINAFLEACTLEAEGNADFLDQALAAGCQSKSKASLDLIISFLLLYSRLSTLDRASKWLDRKQPRSQGNRGCNAIPYSLYEAVLNARSIQRTPISYVTQLSRALP